MEGNVEGRVRISEHAPSRKTLEKKSSRTSAWTACVCWCLHLHAAVGFTAWRILWSFVEEMAGVVLETLSNRKLLVFGAILLLVQIGFFLIGGLIGELSYSVTFWRWEQWKAQTNGCLLISSFNRSSLYVLPQTLKSRLWQRHCYFYSLVNGTKWKMEITFVPMGWPKKVSHCSKSSLNCIKTRAFKRLIFVIALIAAIKEINCTLMR